MTETETNQNEAGDSQKPEQVEQAKAMEMEAKEAVETVKEEAENDLKKEFPFAEPTVLKGETSSNEAKKSPEPSTSSAKTQAQTRVVVFSKTEEGIDFSLSGGIPMVGKEEKLPICISHIKPGGVADRVGGLKIGDQLISVNGVSVEGQRRELANELLKMNSSVKLVVRPKVLEGMESKEIKTPTDKENTDNAEKFLKTLSPQLASNPEIREKSKILQDFIDKLKDSHKNLEGLSKVMSMTKALESTPSGKRPASSMEMPSPNINPVAKKLKSEDQTLTIQLSGSALSSGSASSITISGIGGSGYRSMYGGPYDSLRSRMRGSLGRFSDKRDSSTGSPKDEESKDKDSKDDKTSKEPSKEKPKKLAPLMNKNPFGGMMGAMGLDDDLLDDLDDMESKLFGRSRKNQKKEEDPRLAYLKNIPQKHVEKIENEIMETLANVSWDEICGLQFVKGTIREIVILPFLRPDIFNGILQPPTGLLLFGPPGTGKTMLGKCIASQCKSTFFNISAASLTSMWFGETEKTIRALFAVAKAHQPSVIFIDEIDSLLRTRGSDESDATRRSKTELLAQIDGMRSEKDDKILVIGATNRPQDLDDAARRRFIKRLYVPLPEQEARIHIAKRLLAKQKHDLNDEDFEKIGTMTNGYSGADMTNLTKEAALGPIRCLDLSKMDDIKKEDVRNVKFTDFEKAFTQIKASVSEQNTKEYEEWNKQYGSTKDSVSASKDHLNMYC